MKKSMIPNPLSPTAETPRGEERQEVIRDEERDRLKHREMPGGDQLFCHVCALIWLQFPIIPQSCLKARFATGGILSGKLGLKTESMYPDELMT